MYYHFPSLSTWRIFFAEKLQVASERADTLLWGEPEGQTTGRATATNNGQDANDPNTLEQGIELLSANDLQYFWEVDPLVQQQQGVLGEGN